MSTWFKRSLWAIAILGTAFQVGHFVEHAAQAGEWVFVDRTQAWMSTLACDLSLLLNASMARGMEVLHLTGNLIFLVTLAAWWKLKGSAFRAPFLVEAFHLTEHISLTATVFLYGKAAGWSTLFGFAPELLGHNGAVGFRVLWHFGMNLIPSAMMAWAMRGALRRALRNVVVRMVIAGLIAAPLSLFLTLWLNLSEGPAFLLGMMLGLIGSVVVVLTEPMDEQLANMLGAKTRR